MIWADRHRVVKKFSKEDLVFFDAILVEQMMVS